MCKRVLWLGLSLSLLSWNKSNKEQKNNHTPLHYNKIKISKHHNPAEASKGEWLTVGFFFGGGEAGGGFCFFLLATHSWGTWPKSSRQKVHEKSRKISTVNQKLYSAGIHSNTYGQSVVNCRMERIECFSIISSSRGQRQWGQ